MLTPIEIQKKTFKNSGMRYDKRDVDAFLDQVTVDYETLYRENRDLKDKLSALNERVQYFSTQQDTISKSVLLAQNMANGIQAQAEKEAKHIIREAKTKAEMLLGDAQNELAGIHQQTIELVQQYERFKQQFRALASSEMELLSSPAFDINIQRLDAFTPYDPHVAGMQDDYQMSEEESGSYEDNSYDEAEEAYADEASYEDQSSYEEPAYEEPAYHESPSISEGGLKVAGFMKQPVPVKTAKSEPEAAAAPAAEDLSKDNYDPEKIVVPFAKKSPFYEDSDSNEMSEEDEDDLLDLGDYTIEGQEEFDLIDLENDDD